MARVDKQGRTQRVDIVADVCFRLGVLFTVAGFFGVMFTAPKFGMAMLCLLGILMVRIGAHFKFKRPMASTAAKVSKSSHSTVTSVKTHIPAPSKEDSQDEHESTT